MTFQHTSLSTRALDFGNAMHEIHNKQVLLMGVLNSLWPSDTIWQQIWVNIISGNGLWPDGTKPLPEPLCSVKFSNIHMRAISGDT